MDWAKLLFSFGGRINRARYWLAILIFGAVWLIFSTIALSVLGGIDALTSDSESWTGVDLILALPAIILLLAGLWSGLAVAIKRLHDRNKSGWWLLLFWAAPSVLNGAATAARAPAIILSMIGALIGLWGFVEIGCLKGTAGPNRYGPDPLAEPTGQ